MASKKRSERVPVPDEVAARVLFLADRVCCVCRKKGKVVQIHHIDEKPANNQLANLAVLCFDCHRETQIRGGFDRKLDAPQIILYRDDWNDLVAQKRAREDVASAAIRLKAERDLALAMSIAEIYREHEAYDRLAIHYHHLGSAELRDKYIELAITQDPSDHTVIMLRGMQQRMDRVPAEVISRTLQRYTERSEWRSRAILFHKLNQPIDAIKDYMRAVLRSLEDRDKIFSAAFLLKECVDDGLITALFVESLRRERERGDLWWQIRCLQELGWKDALRELILQHAQDIDTMVDSDYATPKFKLLLADARGDKATIQSLRKAGAERAAKWALDRRDRSRE